MTDSCKRLVVGGDKLDRLTSLPINVIHQIQECMPIEDATRMSVLSSTWRYVWSSNPKLIFDTQFCRKRKLADIIDIISTILLQHHGAIKIFLLDISKILQHSVVDKWMLFLSRNGILDLTLLNLNKVNPPYKLPSYLFNVGLERLVLSNCIFRPPHSFKGFDKIKYLSLNQVAFELDAATSSLWMPNLVSLYFFQCSGLRFLNIHAPELLLLQFFFHSCETDTLNLSSFMDCGKLQVVGIALLKEVQLNIQDKEIELMKNLLSSWPNVHTLVLDGKLLKLLASGAELERLPTSLNNLRVLYLPYYDFDGEDQDHILPLLSILRSSPNLKELIFLPDTRKKTDMGLDINLLEGPNCGTEGLNNLQKLVIRRFRGSRTELRFVKLILASTPLLHKAILSVDTSVDESRSLKISKALMRFPRASPHSEIIYEPWSKDYPKLVVHL